MSVNWKRELQDLVESAKSPEDRAATEAFAKAIGPYLANPELLRTLLGKIQAHAEIKSLKIIAENRITL